MGDTVFTIGYQGRTPEDFADVLVVAGVELLVDVRENPVSRKPGFGRRAVEELLASRGIGYRHERQLGNPKANRTAPIEQARSVYLRRLDGQAADAYRALVSSIGGRRVALLCFEADVARCHRSWLAGRLAADAPSLTVVDL